MRGQRRLCSGWWMSLDLIQSIMTVWTNHGVSSLGLRSTRRITMLKACGGRCRKLAENAGRSSGPGQNPVAGRHEASAFRRDAVSNVAVVGAEFRLRIRFSAPVLSLSSIKRGENQNPHFWQHRPEVGHQLLSPPDIRAEEKSENYGSVTSGRGNRRDRLGLRGRGHVRRHRHRRSRVRHRRRNLHHRHARFSGGLR